LKARALGTLSGAWQRGRAVWAALALRERVLLGSAAMVVLLALLWWVGVAPALATLRTAESQHRTLDAELQNMRAMAAEAASLQATPRVKADDGRKALELSVKERFAGTAQLAVAGDRATVTLKGAAPGALAEWLVQARSSARALPLEARLSLNAARTGWDGSIVLTLPP
jgi:general secretion pathway protein M